MDVYDVLQAHEDAILDQAVLTVRAARFQHYESRGERWTRERLRDTFTQVVSSLRHRDLAHLVQHCEKIANDRFSAGFDFVEVNTAFNGLEQAMWRTIVAGAPAEQVVEWIGLLSSVLGAGKDAVARTYVKLATHRHAPAIDVAALSEGTG